MSPIPVRMSLACTFSLLNYKTLESELVLTAARPQNGVRLDVTPKSFYQHFLPEGYLSNKCVFLFQLQENQDEIENMMNAIFKGVFVHRYR